MVEGLPSDLPRPLGRYPLMAGLLKSRCPVRAEVNNNVSNSTPHTSSQAHGRCAFLHLADVAAALSRRACHLFPSLRRIDKV
jgi:hypothetical protein